MRSDEQLMTDYLAGDEEAFRQLFDKYGPKIRRLMAREIRNDAKCDELVQQTFLQLHRARRDFDTDSKVRPWLYTIALNLRRDYQRKASTHRESSVEKLTYQPADEAVDQQRVEHREQVKKALDEVKESQRRVVELHWFEDLTYAEIAGVLDISESAAKVRAHRAYKTMRYFLKGDS